MGQQYVLGNHADELARLDHQAAAIERPTRLLLQAAGLAHGIASADQLNLATLEQRIADAVLENDAVILPPTVAGAWGDLPE